MTEGPAILFLKNKLQRYKGKIVSKVSGEGKIDRSLFEKIQLLDIQTFGKNFLFIFSYSNVTSFNPSIVVIHLYVKPIFIRAFM